MENKSFDDIIKNKLDQFSSEIDSNAWELFQDSQLDASFDEELKEKISEYSISGVPTDFDSFAEEIPVGFDALIGAKLAGLDLDASPDWENFEKILDSDEAFDKEVADTVEGYQVSAGDSQWPKLAEHLEKVEKRRRRIIITKFIEAAVFLLFILTIMQLYPIQDMVSKSVFRTVGVTNDLNSGIAAANVKEEQNDKDIVSLDEIVNIVSLAIENIGSREIPPVALRKNREISYRPRFVKNTLPVISVKEIETHTEGRIAYQDDHVRNLKHDLESLEHSGFNEDYLLATLDIKNVDVSDRQFDYLNTDISSLVKKDQFWFNVYGSPELNLLHTPYDKSYSPSRFIVNEEGEQEAYSHMSHGYSVGASISKETANIELGGGIEYSSLNYSPKQIKEITGKATTGFKTTILKEIIFGIVEIPLNLKYNIFRKKGWQVYGTNGISAGVVAFADYDIDETFSKPLASVEIAGKSSITTESTFVDRKDFDSGFFRSGNFLKNAFSTVNVGVGVSKEISDQISFYVQPTYYHNLSQGGLGPNNDVHHRLSLQIGTKVRI